MAGNDPFLALRIEKTLFGTIHWNWTSRSFFRPRLGLEVGSCLKPCESSDESCGDLSDLSVECSDGIVEFLSLESDLIFRIGQFVLQVQKFWLAFRSG